MPFCTSLGALGSLVAKTLTDPPNPESFRMAANEILSDIVRECGWMYATRDVNGDLGSVRHTIWSEMVRCPACRKKVSLWIRVLACDQPE